MGIFQADTYGEHVAEVYDDWYDVIDEATVPMLKELAGNGRALELGIGTGRVAIPLQQAGVAVEGIDASEAMVAKLHSKPGGGAIPVVIGDMVDVAVEGEYALVFIMFSTFFGLLTQEDQVRCFRNVAQHLGPQGSFVIEAFVPDVTRFTAGQAVRTSDLSLDAVRLLVSQHDIAAQTVTSQMVVLTEEGVRLYPTKVRYVWPSELDLMAQLAGLELRHRWENWRKEPFTSSSPRHISVYGRPQA